ncbi:MAG: heterodisulfide reductase-related iron-sulfur binding cluster [Pyrobaculum sp.]|uniref:heterodisulfide reductase-related iron-sulfur binding cluster n=1 Tax=Pyrobaculum sp. TaxID=2004705 RepID=UPI003EEE25B1
MDARYVEYLGVPHYTFLIVYTLAALSVLALLYGLSKTYRGVGLLAVTKQGVRRLDKSLRFVAEFLSHYRFLSRQVFGGTVHLLLIVGLGISLIGTIIVSVVHYTGVEYGGLFFLVMRFLLDVAAVFIIYGSLAGIYRVYAGRERYGKLANQYILVLLGFLAIAVTGMIMRRYRVDYYLGGPSPWSPLSYLVPPVTHEVYLAAYFVHIAVAFALIAVSPLVMLRHMYLAYANYLLVDRPLGELTTPFELEKVMESGEAEITVGVKKKGEWRGIHGIMFDACTRCSRCQDVCPAFAAKRPLSPMSLITKIAEAKNDADLFEVGITEDEVWACTTCGACMYQCPVYIRHVDYIVDLRRALVFESKVDQKKADLLMSVSQYHNTLMQANVGRHDWLRELGVKHISENPQAEYLLWVGCMGSFDGRAREIVKAFVKILEKAGMLDKVAVLGDEETCCGDPVRRLGEESRFQELVLNNKQIFEKYGVKKLVTICPHGYNTFKNEYPRFGVKLEVYHHVEVLQHLVEEGKITVRGSLESLTIHDPCYLSRHNKVVEPQRKIVVKLGALKEPPRHGERTFCCGAGGANYWYDVPEEKRISHIRFEELAGTGAETIVTQCPFCNAMLTEAKRAKDSAVNVKDIAEVVAEKLA